MNMNDKANIILKEIDSVYMIPAYHEERCRAAVIKALKQIETQEKIGFSKLLGAAAQEEMSFAKLLGEG